MSEARLNLPTDQITKVDRHIIHRCETQPRKHFDESELEELSASMKAHGFNPAWPLLVRASRTIEGHLELVAGERRFRTAESLGIDEVPVIVQEMDDQTMFELQLVENVQRSSLTALEEARAYVRMRDEFGYEIEAIAQKVGKCYDTIAMRITMLRAPESMQELLDKPGSGIAERHLVLVARVPDKKMREECAKMVIAGDWDHRLQEQVPLTVRRTAQLIRERFMVSMKSLAWSVDDAELLPEAGPCSGCQYLAKNFLAGTDDLQEGKTGKRGVEPMTCCNPACFDRKKEAAYERACAQKKAGGVALLSAKEKKETFREDGGVRFDSVWVPVTDRPPSNITQIFDDTKAPTYETLIASAKVEPEKRLGQLADGKVVEMIKREVAESLAKTLKKQGTLKREKVELTEKEKKAKEKEAYDRKVAEQVKIQTLAITRERILAKGIGLDEQRTILDMMLNHAGMDGLRLMCDWLKLEPEKPTKKGDNLNQGHYRAAVMKLMADAPKPEMEAMTIVAFMAKNVKQGWALDYFVKPIMTAFGIDDKAIRTAAISAVDAEIEAKKAKVKKKVEKAPLKPGQKGVRKGAFDTGDSGAPVEKPGARTEPEEVYNEKAESGDAEERAGRDWLAEWNALPKKPGKDKPAELRAWNAKRMQIKRGAARDGVELPVK